MKRHLRQSTLPAVGPAGQARLERSRVLIVGLGGLGCPAALYLASAGVGDLILCDHDTVDESNLARQVLYGDEDLGRRKVDAAAEALARRAPELDLRTVARRMDAATLAEHLTDIDAVIDASDNYATRLAVNEACLGAQTPWIMGAAIRFEGQVLVLRPDLDDQPCYHCLYGDAASSLDDCQGAGVFTPLTGTIGTALAGEVLRLLLGFEVRSRLHLFDARHFAWRELAVRRSPSCPTCAS